TSGCSDLPKTAFRGPASKTIFETVGCIEAHGSGFECDLVDVPAERYISGTILEIRDEMECDLNVLTSKCAQVENAPGPASATGFGQPFTCDGLPGTANLPDFQLAIIQKPDGVPIVVSQSRRVARCRNNKFRSDQAGIVRGAVIPGENRSSHIGP